MTDVREEFVVVIDVEGILSSSLSSIDGIGNTTRMSSKVVVLVVLMVLVVLLA